MMNKPDLSELTGAIKNVVELLKVPHTESTKDTPLRVAKAYLEMFRSLYEPPPKVSTFPIEGEPSPVMMFNVEVKTTCEHHLLPITGFAHILYKPTDSVIGLSKIPRIVEYFCKKPQLQERLTSEIQQHLMKSVNMEYCVVVIEAHHDCCKIRGVEDKDSFTRTESVSSFQARYEIEYNSFCQTITQKSLCR
jgi:GTP cyclohydrolase I